MEQYLPAFVLVVGLLLVALIVWIADKALRMRDEDFEQMFGVPPPIPEVQQSKKWEQENDRSTVTCIVTGHVMPWPKKDESLYEYFVRTQEFTGGTGDWYDFVKSLDQLDVNDWPVLCDEYANRGLYAEARSAASMQCVRRDVA